MKGKLAMLTITAASVLPATVASADTTPAWASQTIPFNESRLRPPTKGVVASGTDAEGRLILEVGRQSSPTGASWELETISFTQAKRTIGFGAARATPGE